MPASEKDANIAREMFSGELVGKGAHAIGVESGAKHGHDGFVVVAYVQDDHGAKLPSSLSLPAERGAAKVPLVTRRAERFKAE